MTSTASSNRMRLGTIAEAWWPLAVSWILMGLEIPTVSAFVARLPDPKITLAAFGGLVFPIALVIEAPIIMLLAASTAMSRDLRSYRIGQRFMLELSGILTVVHVLVVFTPLYDFVARGLIGAPADIVEPARIGLRIMTPWTFSIAYRRFQQGVLIRFGRPHAVGIGTAIRLIANLAVLVTGWYVGHVPGIAVGSVAVTFGVACEAVYAGLAARAVLRERVAHATPVDPPLTVKAFARFYAPLMVTPLFVFFALPMTSAAMSRMPLALESLAVWPVVYGLVLTLRSLGFAFNEVVVSMLDRPGAARALRRFARTLAVTVTAVLLVITATPLARVWFARVSALPVDLVPMASAALWLGLILPGITVFQSLYQGTIVHSRRTRAVTEAVMVYLVVAGAILIAGIRIGRIEGIDVGLAGLVVGNAAQLGWLWFRARKTLRAMASVDAHEPAVSPALATQ